MMLKMKNRSHRYDINRTRSGHGRKYTKYKNCAKMMRCLYKKVCKKTIPNQPPPAKTAQSPTTFQARSISNGVK